MVPDTNQFHGDQRLRGRKFRILLGEHDRKNLVVAIPEPVLRELPKQFAKQLKSAHDAVQREAGKLSDLGHPVKLDELPDVDAAKQEYDKALRDELAQRDVLTPGFPPATVEEMFDQSVAEERPFRAKSQGFRDAVIWRTVRELAKDDDVVLITQNHKDFAVSEKQPDVLHPDLVKSLEDIGLPGDRVELVPDLDTFIDKYVPSSAGHLDTARQLLATDSEFSKNLWSQVTSELYRLQLGRHDSVTIVASGNARPENLVINDVGVDEIEVVDAYETDEEDLVSLEIVVAGSVEFGFTVTSWEAEWLVEEKADVDFDEWHSGFAQGTTGERLVTVTLGANFNVKTGELSGLEKILVTDRDPDGDD